MEKKQCIIRSGCKWFSQGVLELTPCPEGKQKRTSRIWKNSLKIVTSWLKEIQNYITSLTRFPLDEIPKFDLDSLHEMPSLLCGASILLLLRKLPMASSLYSPISSNYMALSGLTWVTAYLVLVILQVSQAVIVIVLHWPLVLAIYVYQFITKLVILHQGSKIAN